MNFMELMAKLSLDTSDYSRGLTTAKSLATSVSRGIGKVMKVGAMAVGAASAAMVAFGASSVKTGMEFDKSMSQVAATMGKTMDEMENEVGSVETSFGHFEGTLRDFAQYMGRNTAFSATQAADALNYMALAGYTTQESMTMLPNVLSLAAAGSMDLARASDMVTDTQTAFGITAERTTQMVDEMAKAASTGNTSVEQLGDAFLTVGGLAQELNGGFVTLADGTQKPVDGLQEMEIMLTAMANAGIKGSEAGTHMRNMLLKLSSPTDKGVKQLEALGVSVFDAEGNMRSMKDVMGDLSGALGDLTQEEKIQAIADLFNTRDIASAEALLNAVGQDWDEIGESILDAEGAAAQMAETQLDNLAGDITLFQSALEGTKIAISDSLTGPLREFVQFGTEGLQRLTEAFKADGLSGAMEEFGSILSDGINMLFEDLPGIVEAGEKLITALGEGLIQNMPLLAGTAMQVLSELVMFLLDSLPTLIDAGFQLIMAIAVGLIQNIPIILPKVAEVIMEIAQAFADKAPLLITAALEMVKTLAQGLLDNLPMVLRSITDMVTEIVGYLSDPGNISDIIDVVISLIMMLTDTMLENTPILIDAIPQILDALIVAILENLPKIIEMGIELTLKLTEGIIKATPQLLLQAPLLIMSLIKGIGAMFVSLINVGKDVIYKIRDGFKGKISEAPKWVGELMSKFLSSFSSSWKDIVAIGTNLVQGIWAGISGSLKWIKDRISGWVGNVTSFIKRLFKIGSPSKLWRDEIGVWLAKGIGVGFVDAMPDVEKMMQEAMPDTDSFIDEFDPFGGTEYEYRTVSDNNYSYAQSRRDSELMGLLRDIRDNMDTDLVLSDGTLVGWMDKALGRRAAQKARGNA